MHKHGQDRIDWTADMRDNYATLRTQLQQASARAQARMLSVESAREKGLNLRAKLFPPNWAPHVPQKPQVVEEFTYTLSELLPLVNWSYFYAVFGFRGKPPYHTFPALFDDPEIGIEARKLRKDIEEVMAGMDGQILAVKGARVLHKARARGDDICVEREGGKGFVIRCLRQQEGECLCLADFVSDSVTGVLACWCVLVYMYVCVCVYVLMYIGVYVCMCVCMCSCMYVCVRVCMCSCICIHIYIYIYLHIYIYMCMYVCIYIYMCVCVLCMHMYIHIYIYIYTLCIYVHVRHEKYVIIC
jgi:hypothetical protein